MKKKEENNLEEGTDERIDTQKIDRIDRHIDSYKIREKEDDALKVVETVFDNKTRMILMSMINNGHILEVGGSISTGKEANVYFAPAEPEAKAIKIFRIDFPSFKKMRPYIEGDHRFKRVKSSRSGFIESWAKKEFKNLQRMTEHNIPCPEPFVVERNILVMQYLGTEEYVLPRLKDVEISSPKKLYKNIMGTVRKLYRDAHLIHADLSEFNILYNMETDQYFIIDVSQAVLWDHPRAEEFLLRDLHNMNRYFSNFEIELIDLRELYRWISGEDPSEITLSEVVGL